MNTIKSTWREKV
jgi:hypothetical protein